MRIVEFFICNALYRNDYRLRTFNDRSLWESREAPSFKVRRWRPDTRVVLLKFIVACARDEYIALAHRSPLPFLPFREYPRDSRTLGQARVWNRPSGGTCGVLRSLNDAIISTFLLIYWHNWSINLSHKFIDLDSKLRNIIDLYHFATSVQCKCEKFIMKVQTKSIYNLLYEMASVRKK